MWLGWVITALVVVVFWAVPITATLMLFPKTTQGSDHRSPQGIPFRQVPRGGTRGSKD
jgi:hypothetical protein